ncbi:MAG: MTH938/NDUFAF3 family protein [Chloroflexota bacterium]|nr:MTH938/NDUFAF3 family protein [Chloroflexota bacterium]
MLVVEKGGKKRKKKRRKEKKSKKGKEAEEAESPSASETPLPMIDQFEYGTIVIGGQTYDSDVIIFPDGEVERWQPKDEHVLRPKDVNKVIKAKPEAVIIGLGTVGNLKVRSNVEERFQKAGIEVMVHKTGKACETYKQLRGQRRIAAILHVTC